MHPNLRQTLWMIALALVAASMALATAAAAGADDGDDDGGGLTSQVVDFTTGSGTATFGPGLVSTFDFEVTSGPAGENPTGFATLRSAFGRDFSGPATCLRVAGNLAVFEVDSNAPEDVRVFVGDFGLAGVDDQFNFHFISPGEEADATCPDPAATDEPVIVGDIVVGDDTARPGACASNDDEDGDGLTDDRESLFSTLLGNADSDFDGIADGNDDANGNGEDDEDEDDDEDDGCPDEDSDGDGEDDEDEDDD